MKLTSKLKLLVSAAVISTSIICLAPASTSFADNGDTSGTTSPPPREGQPTQSYSAFAPSPQRRPFAPERTSPPDPCDPNA